MKLRFVGKEPRQISGGYDSYDLQYGDIIEFSDFLYRIDSKGRTVCVLIEANSDGWGVEYDSEYKTKEEMFADWEVVEITLEEISNFIADNIKRSLLKR